MRTRGGGTAPWHGLHVSIRRRGDHVLLSLRDAGGLSTVVGLNRAIRAEGRRLPLASAGADMRRLMDRYRDGLSPANGG